MNAAGPLSLDWDPRSSNKKLKAFENELFCEVSPSRSQTSMGSVRSRQSFDDFHDEHEKPSEESIKMKRALSMFQNELISSEVKQTVGYTGFHPKGFTSLEKVLPDESRKEAILGYTGYYPGMIADKALARSGNMRTAGFQSTSSLIEKSNDAKFRSVFDTERPHSACNGFAVYDMEDNVSEAPMPKKAISNSSSTRGIRGYTGHEPFFANDNFGSESKQVVPVLGYTGYYAGKSEPQIEQLKQHPLSLAEQMKADIRNEVRINREMNAKYKKPEIVFGDDMYYHRNRQFRRPITPLLPKDKHS